MKKIGLFIFVFFSVIITSIGISYAQSYSDQYSETDKSQQGPPVFRVEYETDRPGADLRSGFPVDKFSDCMHKCADSSKCRAFTWVDIGQQPGNDRPLCWLKSSVPGKTRNSGMISGVKQ